MRIKDLVAPALLSSLAAAYVWQDVPPAAFQSAAERNSIETSVYYSGCDEVRALGEAPLYAGEPGYRSEMDGDDDGIACEPHRQF